MAPVRKKGRDKNIRHPRQIGRLRKDLVVIENAVEQGSLGKDQQKGKQRKQDGELIKNRIQPLQDDPVEIIVFRMQGRRHGMQEQRKFQHQGITKQYDDIGRILLSEDTDHGKGVGIRNLLSQNKDNSYTCTE